VNGLPKNQPTNLKKRKKVTRDTAAGELGRVTSDTAAWRLGQWLEAYALAGLTTISEQLDLDS